MANQPNETMVAWRQQLLDWAAHCVSATRPLCLHLDGPGVMSAAAHALTAAEADRVVFVTSDAAAAERLADGLTDYAQLLGTIHPIHPVPEVEGLRRQWIPENEAARCAALHAALSGRPGIFVTSAAGLLAPTVSAAAFRQQVFHIAVGDDAFPPEALAERLLQLDYDNEVEVHMPGEFSRRGGVFDVYSPLYDAPVRIEYFGDTIETMRQFDPETQRSYRQLEEVRIVPRGEAARELHSDEACATFLDYVGNGVLFAVCDPDAVTEHLEQFGEGADRVRWQHVLATVRQRLVWLRPALPCPEMPEHGAACRQFECRPLDETLATFLPELGADAVTLHWQMLRDQMLQWSRRGRHIVACCGNDGEASRFRELLDGDERTRALTVEILPQALDAGLLFPNVGVVLLSEHEVFGKRVETRRRRRSPYRADYAVHDEMDLEEECYAVHAVHGICLYHGIREIDVAGVLQEALELEFADDAVLYVPLDQAHLVSRYVGGRRKLPRLHAIGSASWKRSKAAAAAAAFDLAAELLRIEAMRKNSRGIGFTSDHDWEHAFAQSFPYEETPDQRQAIADVLEDMANPEPMDRLLCGDVGYGKTEVAMRAAFRAVMNGKQAAVLVPTTVLAQQHYMTFRDRMAEYPVQIDMLSRFRTPSEQDATLERLALGRIDIVIGTHRLIQDDVEFNDLGLLVIDEEQRFGVKHKETLKRLRASVDILTMTATPIPRTLYFSLAGIKNLSTIMTPPAERLPIRTVVAQFDDQLVRQAILHERERGGQVFFLHNRVQTIRNMCRHLMDLVPEARFGVAHGQMPAVELEEVMIRYVEGRIDVLVCTTIIESGLDIPNANTIIIDRADRFGLAELYQLRGRVGRYHHQAYAYLMLPPMGALPKNARERLAAIRQYTHLGAGFKLALRDLEIRGAGNILGTEQSGHVAAVGFELYCELLREAVAKLESRPAPSRADVDIRLDWVCFGMQAPDGKIPAAIPAAYVESPDIRLECYRRLSRIGNGREVDEFADELRDRFGPLPDAARTLLEIARIRCAATAADIQSIAMHNTKLVLRSPDGLVKTPEGKLPELHEADPHARLDRVKSIVHQLADRQAQHPPTRHEPDR